MTLHLRATGCHLSFMGSPVTWHKWTHPALTPALTPARQASTRFTYPGGMQGWVDLGDRDGLPAHSTNPAVHGRESNSWPVDHESDALTTTPPSHLKSQCPVSPVVPRCVWVYFLPVLVDVTVLRDMNTDYQQCLSSCKQLSQRSSQFDATSQSALSAMSLTTDRLLYSCAIEMVCLVRYRCKIYRFILCCTWVR